MVEIGDRVEDFELPDKSGTPRRLSDFLARGPVALFFYPVAMSAGCTAECLLFRDMAAEFVAVGAQRVGISTDGVEKQRRFVERNSLGFPLLSDEAGAVARQFGVKRRFGPIPVKRRTFVIDTNGRVLGVVKSEVSMSAHANRTLEILRRR